MNGYVRRQQFLMSATQCAVIGWMLIGIGFHWGYNQLAFNVVDTPEGVLIAGGQSGPGVILGPVIGTVGILIVGLSLSTINVSAIENGTSRELTIWLVAVGHCLVISIGAAMAETAVSALFAVLVGIIIGVSAIHQ